MNETTVSDALVDHLFDADACVEQLVQRLHRLPADLLAAVEAEAKRAGVPNLRGGGVDTAHLMIVDSVCRTAEAEHAVRVKEVDEALEDLDEATQRIVVDLAGGYGARRMELLELEAERVVALAAAATWLCPPDPFAGLDGGPAALTVNAQHFDTVVEKAGGKAAVLALGKQLAATHGLTPPRSTADIAASPVLAALVAAG